MIKRAKITAQDGYKCSPEGFKVEVFPFGAIVEGRVAEWALAAHAASAMFEPRTEAKVTGPDEIKAAPKKRGRPRKKAS